MARVKGLEIEKHVEGQTVGGGMIYVAVTAEHNHTCIHTFDGARTTGELEYEDLNVPKELRERFRAWSGWYGDRSPGSGVWPDPDFEAEGLRLAVELKKHLGAGWEVLYIGEAPMPVGQVVLIVHEDGSTTPYQRSNRVKDNAC